MTRYERNVTIILGTKPPKFDKKKADVVFGRTATSDADLLGDAYSTEPSTNKNKLNNPLPEDPESIAHRATLSAQDLLNAQREALREDHPLSLQGKFLYPGIRHEQQPAKERPLSDDTNVIHKQKTYDLIYPRKPVPAITESEYNKLHKKNTTKVARAKEFANTNAGGTRAAIERSGMHQYGHIKRPTQVIADKGIDPHAFVPALNINEINIRNITRMCPRQPCGVDTDCGWGAQGICCGKNHCCPPNGTCLNTDPPTCVYDAVDEPNRCLIEYCLIDHHCPLIGVHMCCSGGETCCPVGYNCTANTGQCSKYVKVCSDLLFYFYFIFILFLFYFYFYFIFILFYFYFIFILFLFYFYFIFILFLFLFYFYFIFILFLFYFYFIFILFLFYFYFYFLFYFYFYFYFYFIFIFIFYFIARFYTTCTC